MKTFIVSSFARVAHRDIYSLQDYIFNNNVSWFKFVLNKLQINGIDHCYHLIKPFQSI